MCWEKHTTIQGFVCNSYPSHLVSLILQLLKPTTPAQECYPLLWKEIDRLTLLSGLANNIKEANCKTPYKKPNNWHELSARTRTMTCLCTSLNWWFVTYQTVTILTNDAAFQNWLLEQIPSTIYQHYIPKHPPSWSDEALRKGIDDSALHIPTQ